MELPSVKSSGRSRERRCSLWWPVRPASSSPRQGWEREGWGSVAQPRCCFGPLPSLRTSRSNCVRT
eukprot:14083656-Alexandrium_andersonii.AAC.1